MENKKGFTITYDGFQCGAPMTCPVCGHNNMEGHGGSFGGRIMSYKRRCPECECTLLIIPMKKDYEYRISAETEEEIEKRLKTEKRISELEKEADQLRKAIR